MEREGGALIITTRMTLGQRLSSPEGHHLPTLLVEFADTGPGIEADVLAELATPFFTTRPGGTGLGLAVAHHWVARHEGTLRVESEAGAGTTVRVAIPLKRTK
jgi:two-component system nitrogen regulation sensor histidine kinase GlnL